jgi:hypothetical protein
MKDALSSSDTSVLTRATRRNIPEDALLHSHRREISKLKKIRTFKEKTLSHIESFNIQIISPEN